MSVYIINIQETNQTRSINTSIWQVLNLSRLSSVRKLIMGQLSGILSLSGFP
jgi:hypothetical protein